MPTKPRLFLHEELLLLALRDEDGKTFFGTDYLNALGGAALAQLLKDGRVRIDGSGKEAKVRSVGAKPLGDDYLDDCALAVRTSKRLRTPHEWVWRFASVKQLKHRVAQSLCDKGVLRVEHDKVLGIFDRKLYPEANPRPEEELIERLRNAIFSDAGDVDPDTAVLVSLANVTRLLAPTFGRKEIARRKERIAKIVQGELAGQAAREAIETMQAALAFTIYLPALFAVT